MKTVGRERISDVELLEVIAKSLPDYFPRTDIEKVTNGLFSAAYISNLMVKGEGPRALYLGKKCVITKESFIEWLRKTYYKELCDGNTERDGGHAAKDSGEASETGTAGEGDGSLRERA